MPALFVYGTLMHGEYYHGTLLEIAGAPLRIAKARVRGRLRMAGAYAAFEPVGNSWVHGEYMTFDGDAWLARLDELEEYKPGDDAHSLYVRREIECTLDDGATARAWTYVVGPLAPGGAPIESGDWRKR